MGMFMSCSLMKSCGGTMRSTPSVLGLAHIDELTGLQHNSNSLERSLPPISQRNEPASQRR